MKPTSWYLFRRFFLRLVGAASVLFGVAAVSFSMLYISPGDPAEILLLAKTESPSPEKVSAIRKELGLDEPLAVRFAKWTGALLSGDLGRSYRTGDKVAREIVARLPVTLSLACTTMLLVMALSLIIGFPGGLHNGSLLDKALAVFSVVSISMPDFVLGIILIYIMSIKAEIFPILGYAGLKSLILPSLTLSLSIAATHGQVLRATVMEVLDADYIRFSYAKGLSPLTVLKRHVARNALLPIVTLWGISFGHLLGGAVIVENVFSLPGLGTLLVDSVLHRDIPVVQGITMCSAVSFLSVNAIVDASIRYFVPSLERIEHDVESR